MPKYNLEYFDGRGRAEVARYILAYGGTDWNDDRFGFEQSEARLTNAPMRMFPVLTVDGQKLSQSLAVDAYLAGEHGLAGKDHWEAAKCLELSSGILIDTYSTVMPWIQASFFQKDAEKAKSVWTEIKAGKLQNFLKMYDKFLEDNGGEWFVGNQVTWTDFAVGEFFDRVESCIDGTLLDSYPKLRDHGKRVHALPQLKKYLDSRPKTPF